MKNPVALRYGFIGVTARFFRKRQNDKAGGEVFDTSFWNGEIWKISE